MRLGVPEGHEHTDGDVQPPATTTTTTTTARAQAHLRLRFRRRPSAAWCAGAPIPHAPPSRRPLPEGHRRPLPLGSRRVEVRGRERAGGSSARSFFIVVCVALDSSVPRRVRDVTAGPRRVPNAETARPPTTRPTTPRLPWCGELDRPIRHALGPCDQRQPLGLTSLLHRDLVPRDAEQRHRVQCVDVILG